MSENILWEWIEDYVMDSVRIKSDKSLSDLILLLLIEQKRCEVEGDQSLISQNEHINAKLEKHMNRIITKHTDEIEALINQLTNRSE